MSSLGYLTVLRLIESRPGWTVERLFLDSALTPLRTLETDRTGRCFSVVGLSVGYELQLPAVAQLLRQMHIEPLAEKRQRQNPADAHGGKASPAQLVVAGGPLTRINPRPLGAMADVCVVGDAETALLELLEILEQGGSRHSILETLSARPGFYVPGVHGNHPPQPLRAPRNRLPARASIWTPSAEFSDMFLIEACRGCNMACRFCAMRKSLSGGAHFVSAKQVCAHVPQDITRVGLVGAEIGHHPELTPLLERLVARGLQVGVSSVRVDKLDRRTVDLLVQGGLRTLTIAADGASQRVRDGLRKGITAVQLVEAARLAGAAGVQRLKLYQLLGADGETDADRAEMIALCLEMSRHVKLELALSVLVPKPNTPLAEHPIASTRFLRTQLKNIQKDLRGRVALKAPNVRGAALEWRLAHGDLAAGRAVVTAVEKGGGYGQLNRCLNPG
jgi:radical SAM superfamily enzyme YgiQ (UPF0313 family)